ncbi:hypothetical protein GOODEAATRI_007825, partial [Goodea atripinnis]
LSVLGGGLFLPLLGCGTALSVLWDICGLRDGLCGTASLLVELNRPSHELYQTLWAQVVLSL